LLLGRIFANPLHSQNIESHRNRKYGKLGTISDVKLKRIFDKVCKWLLTKAPDELGVYPHTIIAKSNGVCVTIIVIVILCAYSRSCVTVERKIVRFDIELLPSDFKPLIENY